MRVLITNDDGIHAPGIAALIDAAKEIGASEIYVIAPEREQSAKSHAITIREPLFITELPQRGATRRIAVRGTPSDCVRLACIKLLDPLPDLCLSGVNHGANLGWDVFFSGTVAAAAEASSFGIPSVGISLCTWQDAEWDE
ncbi:MAG: 5'/3'-nucleotidase SurE, partial [Planctomycetota bacterium]